MNAVSATGLFGAGVAVLFLVSYAGHAYYGLYERDTAFLFMSISTFVGAAVAMRGNLVSIAVLSLMGGNLAPLLLRSDQPKVVGFLSYLLMFEVVALVLAWWGRRAKWWILRGLSLAGKTLWIAALLTGPLGSASEILPFILIYAGLFQAELILSERRKELSGETGVNFSLLVTAALTIAILYYFRDSTDWSLPVLLAVKYILIDTAYWRFGMGPAFAQPFVNISALTAVVVLFGLMVLLYLSMQPGMKEAIPSRIRTISTALIVLVFLWCGTLEIDRIFQKLLATSAGPFTDPALAEQVALSIFWSIFAVLSIIVGFSLRAAALRYFALALFAITLLKVVAVDMSQVSTGYRVLSFIGLGGLLLGTSVLYGRFSPVLLREMEESPL